MIEFLKSTPTVASIDEVLIPGEPETIAQRHKLADGIFIDDTTWSQIVATANSADLSADQINKIAK